MKPETRSQRTIFAVVMLCISMLVFCCARLDAQTDKWITFPAQNDGSHGSDDSTFFAQDLFFQLMGVGTTARITDSGDAQAFSNGLGSGSEVFAEERGYTSHEFDFMPAPTAPTFFGTAVRAGWSGVSSRGTWLKVGEYEDFHASPFWDVDQIMSDGVYTLDLYGTGLDRESTHAGLYLFTPKFSGNVRFRRFLHRLDHDPLTNIPPPLSGEEIVSEDLNVGEDYAVRIQELKTAIKGKLSDSVKYRVNFSMRRKKGERQALGTHHGAQSAVTMVDCRACHVLNQRQQIDWLTLRVEPVVEATVGRVKLEYSRPMRTFSQNDDVVLRSYGDFHGYNFSGDFPYAVVPDTMSQTDRLKIGFPLPKETRVYTQVHRGHTSNRLRDTRRKYYGLDFRVTNRASPKLTLNAFARFHHQRNQLPPFFVEPEGAAVSVVTSIVPPYGLRHPIDYARSSVGADARWRPFRNHGWARGLSLNFGAEHGLIKRSDAQYIILNPPAVYDERRTHYTSYFVGTAMKWHPRFDTFVRYRGRMTADPLYGFNANYGATNTSLPDEEDTVQVGGTWVPADNFIASASVGIENRRNDTPIADFEEDNYPVTLTLWYAPTHAWSLSGGYGSYTNWIDQQIYFPSDDPATAALDRREWNYGGRADVITLGSSYACTESLTLSGRLEYVWASNLFDPLAPWPDLPAYSDVIVDITRYHAGLDWCLNDRISAYTRYTFQDYKDVSETRNSGSAHIFLGGFTGIY